MTANANTATLVAGFDLECFQNALIITFGNNAIQNISTSGCNAILEPLK